MAPEKDLLYGFKVAEGTETVALIRMLSLIQAEQLKIVVVL